MTGAKGPIPLQNRTKMFHVKHFCPVGAENLTRPRTAAHFDLVRSIDILVQFQEGRSATSIARPVAGRHPRCKVRSIQPVENVGLFLRRNYEPKKLCNINRLSFVRISKISHQNQNENSCCPPLRSCQASDPTRSATPSSTFKMV
jgi:hypothetical protein